MLPKLCIVEFVDDKLSMAIAETAWLNDVHGEDFESPDDFDTVAEVEISWPDNYATWLKYAMKGQTGKIKIDMTKIKEYEVRVLQFGDDIELLRQAMIGLKKPKASGEVEGKTTAGNWKTKAKRSWDQSEDESDISQVKDLKPAKNKISCNESEKKAAAGIAAMIAAQTKQDAEVPCTSKLDEKILDEIKGVVTNLQMVSSSLEATAHQLVKTERNLALMEAKFHISRRSSMSESPGNSSQSTSAIQSGTNTPRSSVRSEVQNLEIDSVPIPATDRDKDIERLAAKVNISAQLITKLNHSKPERLTTELMAAIWTRDYMSTHTLTGMKTNKPNMEVNKPGVDRDILDAIQQYVQKVCPLFSDQDFRSVARNKLNNEEKLKKRSNQGSDSTTA